MGRAPEAHPLGEPRRLPPTQPSRGRAQPSRLRVLSPAGRLTAGLGILRVWFRANARPRVLGLLPRGEFLDRGFVRLLVLLALGIGRRARLVPERNADGRP